MVSRNLNGVGVTDREVLESLSLLIRKQNPFALKAQQQQIKQDRLHPGAKISSAYHAKFFIPFSDEMPFLRG